MSQRDLNKAALRGEPSYVWRCGQERRLKMILDAAGDRVNGLVLENGCGVGIYVEKLAPLVDTIYGLEFDFDRSLEAAKGSEYIINAAGEGLPFPDNRFDLILSHEVIEHVKDDSVTLAEMVRTLKLGGRVVMFCPNRGYPFETHGIYWRGEYRFGNIPLINWLPRKWRDKLAPHVRVYSQRDLANLLEYLPVKVVSHKIIFGGYDNIIARFGSVGEVLRKGLQFLERTPLRVFGLSHFLVLEKK
jgi:SAM-dependent methyltransferase